MLGCPISTWLYFIVQVSLVTVISCLFVRKIKQQMEYTMNFLEYQFLAMLLIGIRFSVFYFVLYLYLQYSFK